MNREEYKHDCIKAREHMVLDFLDLSGYR